MLLSEIILFGLLGLATGILADLIITDGKNYAFTVVLMVEGAFFGWLSGMMWVYSTGGMNVTIWAFLLPIVVSLIASLLTIRYLSKYISRHISFISKNYTLVVVVISFAIVGLCLFSITTPSAKISAMNTETFSIDDLQWQSGNRAMTANDIQIFAKEKCSGCPSIVDISYIMGSVTGMKVSDSPMVNSYLEFKVTMTANAVWQKPYIKITVFKDNDANGKISTGDVMWADTSYKLVLSSDETDWRSNCVWKNDMPVSSAFVTQNIVLPIFHANAITQWKDDKAKMFTNTPEGYVPQSDMLSWEQTSTGITLKENIFSYVSVNAGESTAVSGKIYCGQADAGNNLIFVQVFDATDTNPFSQDETPIASEVIPFQISSVSLAGIPTEWSILAVLGMALVLFALYVVKRY